MWIPKGKRREKKGKICETVTDNFSQINIWYQAKGLGNSKTSRRVNAKKLHPATFLSNYTKLK